MKSQPSTKNIVFDNTGTLSESIKTGPHSIENGDKVSSVPFVPEESVRLAQLNIGVTNSNLDIFDTDRSIGEIITGHDIPLHISLFNTDTDMDEIQNKLSEESQSSGQDIRTHFEKVESDVLDTPPGWIDQYEYDHVKNEIPRGVQITLNLDTSEIVRIFGYTAFPKPASRDVLEWVHDSGHVPHIASGDADPILSQVGELLDVPEENIHPFQSMYDKAKLVTRLQEESDRPVVMIGDYVNDTLAFKNADTAIFVYNDKKGAETSNKLTPVSDHQVERISQVPTILENQS